MGSAILAFPSRQNCYQGRACAKTLTPPPPPRKATSRLRKRGPIDSQSKLRDRGCRPQSQSQSMLAPNPAKNIVMGHVKILKRGEKLMSCTPITDARVLPEEEVLGSTDRLGPDPKTVDKEIRVKQCKEAGDGIYAGWAFLLSPPPSSLPFPRFLGESRQG